MLNENVQFNYLIKLLLPPLMELSLSGEKMLSCENLEELEMVEFRPRPLKLITEALPIGEKISAVSRIGEKT